MSLTTLTEEEMAKIFKDKFESDCRSILLYWNTIGFDQTTRIERFNSIKKEFELIMSEIIGGEEKICDNIKNHIESYKQKTNSLLKKLNIHLKNINEDDEMKQSARTLLEEQKYWNHLYERLIEIKKQRQIRLCSLKEKEKALCQVLDHSSFELDENDLSIMNKSELDKYEIFVENLENEKKNRINEICNIKNEIDSIVETNKLKLNSTSSLNTITLHKQSNLSDTILVDQVNIDKESMNAYRRSISNFKNKQIELIETTKLLQQDILKLWLRFCLNPGDENLNYLIKTTNIKDFTKENFDILLREFQRCAELKKSKLKDCIIDLRNKILELLDKIYIGELEKREYDPILLENDITEEIYVAHEACLLKLDALFNSNKLFISCFQNWSNMWENFIKFEVEFSDPARFKSKGYSSLNEEKQRQRFKIELPKIEKQLEKEAESYFEQNNMHYTINGVYLLDYIQMMKQEHANKKQEMRQERIQKSKLTLKQEAKYGVANTKVSTPENRKNSIRPNEKRLTHTNWQDKKQVTPLRFSVAMLGAKSLSTMTKKQLNSTKSPKNFSKMSPLKKFNAKRKLSILSPKKTVEIKSESQQQHPHQDGKKRNSINRYKNNFKTRCSRRSLLNGSKSGSHIALPLVNIIDPNGILVQSSFNEESDNENISSGIECLTISNNIENPLFHSTIVK